MSANECRGRSEGQERGQPRWPRRGDTVLRGPQGRSGGVSGQVMGSGQWGRLGLSPVTLRAGRRSSQPLAKAAPWSNGNFYEQVKSSGFFFFPLKRYFSPSSHDSRGICSPTAAFSMRHPLVSCLSREGSGAIQGIPAAACSPARELAGTSRGGTEGARRVVPGRSCPLGCSQPGSSRREKLTLIRRGGWQLRGETGGRARPLPFRPLTRGALETLGSGSGE